MKKMNFMWKKTVLFAMLFVTAWVQQAKAVQLPTISGRIATPYPAGTAVVTGTPTAKMTITGTGPVTGQSDALVTNIIEFGYDQNYPLMVASTNVVSINVKITGYPWTGSTFGAGVVSNRTFTIDYDLTDPQAIKDKDIYVPATPYYKFDVEIMSITVNGVAATVLPKNMYVDAHLDVDRIYDFGAIINTPLTFISPTMADVDGDALNDEIVVSWNPVTAADEYQLEWTFVNDYNTNSGTYITLGPGIKYNFAGNSTRITTKNTNYRIPLLFDHGYVYFRVRAIGRDFSPAGTFFTVWNTPDNGSGAYTVSSINHYLPVAGTNVHENNLNWQATTTFAEEGKKKEVVSYFDGSLRNRQTVTRINSDKNAVVGETIYDYQGRPAVTVLPVPVYHSDANAGAIKYYDAFNKNSSGEIFTRADFDLDDPGNDCAVNLNGMSTTSGASQYYSPNNPNVNDPITGLVPDAHLHPFAQVEYTPDNTGRIARQGGVGPDFQLDSGHETKYYYGQSSQVQLDRLFASEVGDASHYKKNLVMDANGQVSVSYLDQEGRVIATALAGNSPLALDALESQNTALKELNIDLFAKNSNQVSNLNKPNIENNAIVFSSQFLVASAGYYAFAYDIEMSSISNDCMPDNICFNCIYDLTIHLTDECGADVLLDENNNVIANKVTGKFAVGDNGQLIFSLECGANYEWGTTFTDSVYLGVGAYNISKTLSVNEEALGFYIDTYLNPTYNSCIKTLEEFEENYLSTIDYTGCELDCESCFASLGNRDAFIAQGKGSGYDYDVLYEQCKQQCQAVPSDCEVAYNQMLADVSPGGQYGKISPVNSSLSTADQALSVFYLSNDLPWQNGGSPNGNWRYPKTVLNGTEYPYYINEDGTRATVPVVLSGVTYTPAVVSTGLVFSDGSGGLYTYPENLASETVFVTVYWRPEYAKGLVYLHPEFCYYQKCSDYGKKQTTDAFTSDEFDAAMLSIQTWAAAQSSNPALPNNGKFVNVAGDDLNNLFAVTSANIYDPFVTNTAFSAEAALFLSRYNNYMVNPVTGSGFVSLPQAVAFMSRCQMYNVSPSASCLAFGDNIGSYTTAEMIELRNNEWNTFKSLYVALKKEVKQKIGDQLALASCGVNDCIGNIDDFSPYASGLINFGSFLGSPFFTDPGQPCMIGTYQMYAGRQPRFPSIQNMTNWNTTGQEAAYQAYLQTGQCPKTSAVQAVLNEVLVDNNLTSASMSLLAYNTYNTFYLVHHDYAPPGSIPATTWTSTTPTSDVLNIGWSDVGGSILNMELDKTGTGVANWNDFESFVNLQSGPSTSSAYSYPFTMLGKITVGGTVQYKTINGSINYNIETCLFPDECTANAFAEDIQDLMSSLAATTSLTNTTGVALNTSPLFTVNIQNQLGTPNSNVKWIYDNTNQYFMIRDAMLTSKYIRLKLIAADPTTFTINTTNLNSIQYFDNIKSAYDNFFTVDAKNSSGTLLAELRLEASLVDGGTAKPISMGDCALPTPVFCEGTSYELAAQLPGLLEQIMTAGSFDPNHMNLYSGTTMADVFTSYFGNSSETTSSYDADDDGPQYEERIVITFDRSDCDLRLYTSSYNSSVHLDAVVSLGELIVTGLPDLNGYYYSFKIPAVFDNGSGPVTDTITGVSCLPLNTCIACSDSTETGEGDECHKAYLDYVNAVSIYNNWATTNGFPLAEVIPAEEFTADGYCLCITDYMKLLDNLINRFLDLQYAQVHAGEVTSIAQFCGGETPPCTPATNQYDGTVEMPSIEYTNPCAEQLQNNALENAQQEYNEYLLDLTTDFAAEYKKHCMGAVENFRTIYKDREYHYTLYYYDQAGNLIKTIPPAGVEILNLDGSPGDAISNDINYDRTNNSLLKKRYTAHRMATTYEYNSLNQLEKQSMPDHEKMDIFEKSVPAGLEPNMTVTKIDFVNETRGYLTGYVSTTVGSTSVNRGLLYTTNDAGKTWQRVNDVVGADLNRIYMYDVLKGYACGNQGVMLFTENGGSSWDAIDLYALDVNWNLTDLSFRTATDGVVIGESNKAVRFVSGVPSLGSAMPASTFTTGGYFKPTSVVWHNASSKYFMTARHKFGSADVETGKLYESTDGNTWTEIKTFVTGDLEKVIYPGSGSNYMAFGETGFVQKVIAGGTPSNMDVSTNKTQKIKDAVFLNAQEGVAILLNSTNNGRLHKTNDGGNTWVELGDQAIDYTSLEKYEQAGSMCKAIATAKGHIVKRVLMQSGTAFGTADVTDPTSSAVDIVTSWAKADGVTLPAVVCGANKFYYTRDASVTSAVWTDVSGLPAITIKKIQGYSFGTGSSLELRGVILTTTGALYRYYKPAGSGTTFTFSALTVSGGANVKDIVVNNNNHVIAIDATNQRLVDINMSSSTFVVTVVTGSIAGTIVPTSLAFNGTNYMVVGTNGSIQQATVNNPAAPTTATWSDITAKQVPLGLNDITIHPSSSAMMATGVNGTAYWRASAGTNWQQMAATTTEDLNAFAFGTATSPMNGLFAAQNGHVYYGTFTTTSNDMPLSEATTYTTEHFNDVCIKSNEAIAVANGGVAIVSPAYATLNNFVVQPAIGTQYLRSVVNVPSSNTYLAAGQNANIRKYNGGSVSKVKQVFTTRLNAVHFVNANEGYVAGDKFTARQTTNGGASWNVVLPNTTSTAGMWLTFTTPPNYTGVGNNATGRAFFTANQGTTAYVIRTTNGVIDAYSQFTNTELNAISFGTADYGFAVGGNPVVNTPKYYPIISANAPTYTAPVAVSPAGTYRLRGVHTFARAQVFMAVGSNNQIIHGNTTGVIFTQNPVSGIDYNDIIFSDDVNGYVVGTQATILKSTGFAVNPVNGQFTGGSWTVKPGADNLLGQTTTSLKTINAIGLATRYLGVWGGSTSQASVQKCYARYMRDDSELYSTFFWYDKLGRIAVSQNTRQYAASPKKYSYTLYDEHGRTIEAGEKTDNTTGTLFSEIFGSYVNGFYNLRTINDDSLISWINGGGTRTEVTRTIYDVQNSSIASVLPAGFTQDNLRKRISVIMYYETYANSTPVTNYENATHYSYDIHGNVKTLVQDNRSITLGTYGPAVSGQRFKRIDYTYDLVSGNVHQVSYTDPTVTGGGRDQWHHQYTYDSDNRITEVYTSDNKVGWNSSSKAGWDNDVSYLYYAHGPLVRTEIGNDRVQGQDMVYTLQGWIKGVNSNTLKTERDLGLDGYIPSTGNNPNQIFAKDVIGYTLNYYNDEYQPIKSSVAAFEATKSGSELLSATSNLYNGNIMAMITTITDPVSGDAKPLGNAYRHDQLHRLKKSQSFDNLDPLSNAFQATGATPNKYLNKLTYDANGNILTQDRHDHNGIKFENLDYKYNDDLINGQHIQNRLYHVDDSVTNTALYNDDIEDMGIFNNTSQTTVKTLNNYVYDAEGRLIRDNQDSATIVWRLDGKVKEIIRDANASSKNLKFEYDPFGHRIAKHIYSSSGAWEKSIYYVMDATNKTLASYEKINNSGLSYKIVERSIYGNKRNGSYHKSHELISAIPLSMTDFEHANGDRKFELVNHLGNVLALVSDKKRPIDDSDRDADNNGYNEINNPIGVLIPDGLVDSYTADIHMAQDYSPFGAVLKNRNYNPSEYKYGFQGQQKDKEIKLGNSINFEYRMHDPRLGRFFSIDPLISSYPHYTPYSFSGNKLIAWAELEGKEEILVIREQISANEYKLTYIWDVTAQERGENGMIQYYDVSTGTLSPMRATTLEERKNSRIALYLRIPLSEKTKSSTNESYLAKGYGVQRTAADGTLVPYLQTKRDDSGRVIGESQKTFRDDVRFTGVTAVSYNMGAFRAATAAQKASMTQPDADLRAELNALATEYLNGNARDIKIQITTNNPRSMPNIVESNTMRQNAIINYLVSQGVDRSSIQTLPFLYDQPTWTANVTYDQEQPGGR